MIKFIAAGASGNVIGFGLSRENINRLVEGKPIVADLAALGIAGTEIFIFFGETEQALAKQLVDAGAITQKTVVHKEGP